MEPASLTARIDDPSAQNGQQRMLKVQRRFTSEGQDPFSSVEWSRRDAAAGDFFQAGVEAPIEWSDISVGIVAKLYFATVEGVREDSVRQLISRVAMEITEQGIDHGYFGGGHGVVPKPGAQDRAMIFYEELVHICLHQMASFNTPVWLNVGVPGRKPMCSACFLIGVEDRMLGPGSITDWWSKEAAIFKGGAGSGINLSPLRGSMEKLSTGGQASGPVAYMRTADSGAGTLKSGGAHRRAAKMVQLDVDHPDIFDFVDTKVREDDRMKALREAGFDLDPTTTDGERNIAETTSFQNGNISVRVSDAFMEAVKRDDLWSTMSRVTDEVVETFRARDLMRAIAEAAWRCADPGIMFDDTINSWHTTPKAGRINTSNPCGEVGLPDNSACNLSSINLLAFVPDDLDDDFRIDDFNHVVDVMITAMDITCSFSYLPTDEIEANVREMRPLGLGYANLGAALMAQGRAYDSDWSRQWAASVTALMAGRAYQRSRELAGAVGVSDVMLENQSEMQNVIERHISFLPKAPSDPIWKAARKEWGTLGVGAFRNSQVVVIAPTGTTSFMMGCDTTGCEPAFALVTHKKLAAAGSIKMVNGSVVRAANALGGYSEANLLALAEGDFSCISEEDIDVFHGANEIAPSGHLDMVAAIQPFLSGAASKTINLHNDATVEEIEQLYIDAWEKGVKCVSIYRDGSKATQVLSTKFVDEKGNLTGIVKPPAVEWPESTPRVPFRRRMPSERQSITHKIQVGDYEGYITAGMYADGTLGEIFLESFGKMGSFTQNALSAWATDFSIALQYGVPLEVMLSKHVNVVDETGGMVAIPHDGSQTVVRSAVSIIDYVSRWLIAHFGDADLQDRFGVMTEEAKARKVAVLDGTPGYDGDYTTLIPPNGNGHAHTHDVKICPSCSGIARPAGTCYSCTCGWSSGC